MTDVLTPTPSRPRSRRRAVRLLRNPLVRRFVRQVAIGHVADSIITLTLAQIVVFDLEHGASRGAIARALLVATMPLLLTHPFGGMVSDRVDRRSALTRVHLCRVVLTVLAVTVPLLRSTELGYLVMAMLLGLGGVATTARCASLPHLVDPDHLIAANSLMSLEAKVAGTIGFTFAALLATRWPVALLVIAATGHVVAAIGWARFPHGLGGASAPTEVHLSWPAAVRHVGQLASTTPTRGAIASSTAHRFVHGAAFVAFVLWADGRTSMTASGYTVAIGVCGTGAFVGTLTTPLLSAWFGARQLRVLTLGACSSACLVAVSWPSVPVVFGAMIVVSFGVQTSRLLADATVQAAIDDRSLGRVCAMNDAAYLCAFVVGGLAALCVRTSAPAALLLPIGAVAAVAALVDGLVAGGPPRRRVAPVISRVLEAEPVRRS